MGICRYCQTNAGWLSDAHDYCVQKANAERQKANAERELAKKALDSFEKARPRTKVRALSFAGGDPLWQRLTKELDDALLAKHRGLIDKFLEIAERKVGVVDDYGDENWDALEKEVDRCVLKIAKIEGDERFRDANGEWTFEMYELPQLDSKGVNYGWLKYTRLQRNLEGLFRAYHAKCKANPPTETFDELSGVDFEVYLARLLKKLGFEDVTGTPATGDQGADLLARKDGRKIAIQAKRYKGSVGNQAVQEVVGALKFYKADEGWVITSGRFTQPARALAQANGIHLVDGLDLRKLQQG
ncbi:MAG: restriction endonuclease [Terriglobales bacterium]|jgi:restriction endonuclease